MKRKLKKIKKVEEVDEPEGDRKIVKVETQEVDLKSVKVEEQEADRKRQNKEGRLVVRNLPYKITLEKFQRYFSQCGEINDVAILKKPDGKLVGCGFVQFSSKENAAKAVSSLNGKPLLGRPVIVDWAVPKHQYLQTVNHTSKIKSEEKDTTDVDIKEESEDSTSDDNPHENTLKSKCDDKINEHIYNSDSDNGMAESDGDDDESGISESGEDSGRKQNDSPNTKKRQFKSDVSEGCTVFLKNVPFSVDNEGLRAVMKQFGRICYALICMDPLTEHSKGTGFVKFKSKANAEACIAAGNEKKIILEGHALEVYTALSRDDVKNPKRGEKGHKDSRNLYLAKEGIILADSPAASGLSKADMGKRLGLEERKQRLLKNLHFFISPTRLSVYNIPLSYDDIQLKSLFLKFGGPKATITEARIMRNVRDVDATGLGKSKGFGFVTFSDHENALQALRNLNNNPHVFSPDKRPIVMFSIENRVKLNIQKKRLQKSRKNLHSKNLGEPIPQKDWERNRRLQTVGTSQKVEVKSATPKIPSEHSSEEKPESQHQLSRKERRSIRKLRFKEFQRLKSFRKKGLQFSHSDKISESYQGQNAVPGQTKLSKIKLKEQAKIHLQNCKEKNKIKRRQMTNERIKLPKQKMKKAKNSEKDNFSKLVNQYKQQLSSTAPEQKKWYDK